MRNTFSVLFFPQLDTFRVTTESLAGMGENHPSKVGQFKEIKNYYH